MFSRAKRNVTKAQTLSNVSIACPVVVFLLGGTLVKVNAEAGTQHGMAFALLGLTLLGIAAAITAR